MSDKKDENIKLKEPFCPICIAAVPLAFSLVSGTAVAATDANYEEEQKKLRSNIMFWSIIVSIVSMIVIAYFTWTKCSSCR